MGKAETVAKRQKEFRKQVPELFEKHLRALDKRLEVEEERLNRELGRVWEIRHLVHQVMRGAGWTD